MADAQEIELVFEPQDEGGYHVYAPDLPGSSKRRSARPTQTSPTSSSRRLRAGWAPPRTVVLARLTGAL